MNPKALKNVGELGLLKMLGPMLSAQTAGLPLGTGDDVAVTEPTGATRLVWTIDTMVEGTHFRWWDDPLATPAALAHKLVASNASDLASKGSRPLYALISLAVPAGESLDRITEFYRGLEISLREFGARLIGGDTVAAPQWCLTLALVGELPGDSPIAARSRAMPGQHLYLTRPTGESAAGLQILEGRLHASSPHREVLLNAHLRPKVSVLQGTQLVSYCNDIAMIDVSDGIVKDAGELANASQVHIEIEESAVPLTEALLAATGGNHSQALHFALHGGEDYCLMFCTAVPPPTALGCSCIGRVETGAAGVFLVDAAGNRRSVQPEGFHHFQPTI